jgi:hypothetical protein
MKELIEKVKRWRAGLEEKGLRVNLCKTKIMKLVPGTDRVDANGRLGGTVGRLDRLYRLIDPFSTGSIPQKIDRLDRFSIDFRPQKAFDDVFLNLHCGPKKRHPFYFCNKVVKYRHIFIIFGTQHSEEIWYQVV